MSSTPKVSFASTLGTRCFVAKRRTVTRYRLDDRVELALNVLPPKEGVIRHRGYVTYVDHERRRVWVLFDQDTKIVEGKRTEASLPTRERAAIAQTLPSGASGRSSGVMLVLCSSHGQRERQTRTWQDG